MTQCIAICNTHACRGHHPQVCRLGRLDIGAVIRVFESELLGFALELAYELEHMGHLSGNESTTLHTRRPYVSLVHRWLKNMVQHHVALLVFWWINKMVPPRVLVYWWLVIKVQCCRCKPRCTMAQDVGALVLIANGELVTQELCAVPVHATVHCRRTGFVRRSVWCRCSCRCQWGGAPRTGWFLQKLLISGFELVFGGMKFSI